MEMGQHHEALDEYSLVEDILRARRALGDIMTELLRRKADNLRRMGRIEEALVTIREGIDLARRIHDRCELGAMLRVLGEIYSDMGRSRKAAAAFEGSLRILKEVHDVYECMRTNLAYGSLLVAQGCRDADVYLFEAKQAAAKLDLDYFSTRVHAALGRYALLVGSLEDARSYLRQAESIAASLNDVDRRQVVPELRALRQEVERRELGAGLRAAEKMRALARIYENIRFPEDDDVRGLLLEVVHRVGASFLFLVRSTSRKPDIPLAFNISKTEARRLIHVIKKRSSRLLKASEPVTHSIGGSRLLLIPNGSETTLVASFERGKDISRDTIDFLAASVEALCQLAEQSDLNRPRCSSHRIRKHPGGAFKRIVTQSPEMFQIIETAARAARSNVPILVQGETGVGKELFARAIHESSRRRLGAFVAINAGGMPLNLLESDLFGHAKGAFTDACSDRLGLLESARGGTLFLDEIGDTPEVVQVKLLRLLENGEYRRLGEDRIRKADVRIITATNCDLKNKVHRGAFRKDLYYRISAVRISIPPLRYRPEDVPLLARHLLAELLLESGRDPEALRFDESALDAMRFYPWPGNVRELRNEVERIVAVTDDDHVVTHRDLSPEIRNYVRANVPETTGLEREVERYERNLILKALDEADWNRSRAAELMGLPRTTLIAKMRRLGIVV
jgi:DNA-binding NtrC family response regulator